MCIVSPQTSCGRSFRPFSDGGLYVMAGVDQKLYTSSSHCALLFLVVQGLSVLIYSYLLVDLLSKASSLWYMAWSWTCSLSWVILRCPCSRCASVYSVLQSSAWMFRAWCWFIFSCPGHQSMFSRMPEIQQCKVSRHLFDSFLFPSIFFWFSDSLRFSLILRW